MNNLDSLLDAKIYIVDDDESNRELLQARLELAGFTNLSTAENGPAALELVKRQTPDLILLDVMMPIMNGYQVIEQVREWYPHQFIPIVLLSALQNPEHRVKGIDAGANDFLMKPYDAEELFARVRSLLYHKRAIDELHAEQARTVALLTQIGNPVIVTNTTGAITQVNPAATEQLHLDEQNIGQEIEQIFGPQLGDLLLRAKERTAAVSGVFTPPSSLMDEPVTFNVSISPIEAVGHILFWQDITEIQESERIRLEVERARTKHVFDTFSQYMSPALVERVLRDPEIMTRHEKRQVTVLFADLRGFTALSARQSPDKVMELLNEIFTDLIEIVNSQDGLVLDIVGDELMVAFNVPFAQDNAERLALDTAIELQRQFNRRRTARRERGMEVGLGIGINNGNVVMGHIGGRSHKSYTMVGETVNVAHRMVELAEDRQIITHADLVPGWQPQDSDLSIHELDYTQFRGVPEPIKLSVIEVATPVS